MSADHHDHIHVGHDHGPIAAQEPRAEFRRLERAVRELLVSKGIIGPDDIRHQIELMDSRNPAMGARLVARAWTDPAFKARLLEDAKKAAEEAGIDTANTAAVMALENTDKLHHMVVCTLCSCYPKAILGIPPAWYKSSAYRARAVIEPRKVLAEFGTVLPDDVEIRVVDSTADLRYLVLPRRPAGTDGWTEEMLATIVGRDSMIGTTVPKAN
ncbi:nitrile hydratase subunit alpha [Sphingomonas daechungensis]|uniref:nitrile hydratase subunit alpha n=1 Tax=Sphingomonas daechungensis TaxID=1176646 RepID=UPI003784FDD5